MEGYAVVGVITWRIGPNGRISIGRLRSRAAKITGPTVMEGVRGV
jgi:hypothetical protein